MVQTTTLFLACTQILKNGTFPHSLEMTLKYFRPIQRVAGGYNAVRNIPGYYSQLIFVGYKVGTDVEERSRDLL